MGERAGSATEVVRVGSGGAAEAGARGVVLRRLDGDGPDIPALRSAVLRLRLAPGQRSFTADATATLPRADADPNRTPFAVVRHGTAVGFGILGRLGSLAAIADEPARAVMFRAFYIAPEWQGQGIGRAACAALDPLVREAAPAATEVLVTVDPTNHAAMRCYLAGGFTPTGRHHHPFDAAPHPVLRRPVVLTSQ
jgi:RimJ/RimL family protein N-acetyltransferase